MKMKAAMLALVFILSFSVNCFSQEIQWASEVIEQSNKYNIPDASSRAILGRPDAEPYGLKSKNAFVINEYDGNATVTLSFQNPQQVMQVIIIENYLPGQVSQVYLYDIDETIHKIYESPRKIMSQKFNVLVIDIEKTSYKVQKVMVHVNTYINQGNSQIDAVGICDEVYEGDELSNISAMTIVPAAEITFEQSKERLNDNVNSKYRESKPVITPDGEKLFFIRKNNPENIGKKRDDQDIYFSELIDGDWSLAQNVGHPLNDKSSNGICSVSPDGNTIMLINAYYEDGSSEKGVSVSRKTATGWSFPQKQEIEDYYNISEFEDYCQSNSGKVLFSAVERGDSKGDQDIYISFRTGDDSWSKPENLGARINTSKVEYAPFLASDNKTLYFASNGHGGFGDSDIFYTRRLDDSWTNWSVPKNIGKSINTVSKDGYYTISAKGDYAYFVSTAGTTNEAEYDANNEDIYRISLEKEAKPDPVVLLTGTVVDSRTNKPIVAEIYYESLPNGIEKGQANSDPNTGDYKVVLPIGRKYGIRAEAAGYIAFNRYENLTDQNEYKEITFDLDLAPLKVDQTIRLNNILFGLNKAELLPESFPELERLLFVLNEQPALEIELHGHTDNQGTAEFNLMLSEKRALAIVNYLADNGIDKNRLDYVGFGETKPITDNDSPESRKENRRVEIKIINL